MGNLVGKIKKDREYTQSRISVQFDNFNNDGKIVFETLYGDFFSDGEELILYYKSETAPADFMLFAGAVIILN